MDGMHDLGGKQGFGPVRYTLNAPAFPVRRITLMRSTRTAPIERGPVSKPCETGTAGGDCWRIESLTRSIISPPRP